jgi:hypothetical protein
MGKAAANPSAVTPTVGASGALSGGPELLTALPY